MALKNKTVLLRSAYSAWFRYLILVFILTTSHNAVAVSKYYVFEGRVTSLYEPFTRSATKAGFELDDFIHYVVEMDFDRQGFYISPTSRLRVTPADTETVDYFYANLLNGTEIIRIGVSGVVYENLGANYTDPNQSYINLANYLVLKNNGVNPIDWQIGDEVTSSDRWALQANERMDGSLVLVDILDLPPVVETSTNNWNTVPFDPAVINFVRLHPLNNSIFISGRPYVGLFEKTNNVTLLSSRNNGLGDTNIKDLAFSTGSTDMLYAATLHGGIYKSVSGGNTWVQSNSGLETRSNQSTDAFSVAVSPSNPDIIYAGTLFGLYSSTDAGDSWQAEDTPFNDSVIKVIRITAQNKIFVGTDKGLYQGEVGSGVWSNLFNNMMLIPTNTANVSDIKLHPANQNMVAIALKGIGAYFYYVESGIWEKLSFGSIEETEELILDFAGANGGTVYVAASQSGVFRSDDLNESWSRVTLPAVNNVEISINSFAVDVNEQLVIGSNHNGVYTIDKSMQTISPVDMPKPGDDIDDVIGGDTGEGGGGGAIEWIIVLLLGLFWASKNYRSNIFQRKVY